MREMNWTDVANTKDGRKRQVQFVTSAPSTKVRSEEEQILLARSARNRFKKAVESEQIQIHSKREWTLR